MENLPTLRSIIFRAPMSKSTLLGVIKAKMGGKLLSGRNPTLYEAASDSESCGNKLVTSSDEPINIIENCKLQIRTEIISGKKFGLSSNMDFESLDALLSGSPSLNYESYLQFRSKAPECIRRFFTAQYFLMFPKDKQGEIATEAFLR